MNPYDLTMFKRFWWVFLVMAVAMPILGLMISATITYVMPKKFESTATLEFGDRGLGHPVTVAFGRTLQQHVQAMKSDEVLLKVAGNLELPNKWGYARTEILQQLRNVIQIEQLRGTDLVTVRVRHTNKEDSRDIAAEVVNAYGLELRNLQSGGGSRRSGEWIEPAIPLFVHESPVIAQVPISPNVRLNLLSGILGGLVLSPLLSLPLIWLLHTALRKKSALPL
ncbi:MAG: hypothetical protein CFE26_02255 [Verrucomicrobiales bacterium VVV1]|nr:MAG: hypothetical protein CFE26_02255 [Verrucomicrobiales bacterium VVV1]